MTESTDNSSLPMLLAITGAIVVVAVGGWFYLEQADTPPAEPVAQPASFDSLVEPEETTSEATSTADDGGAPKVKAEHGIDVDAELRKARLAAGADILVFPDGQSALYYYGRVLAADPAHELASAELESVLANVARTVSELLAEESFEDAYAIAVQVARVRPGHDLVTEVQQTLDALTEAQVATAIREAQQGNDAEADRIVAEVATLPGRNPDYLEAVRESIEEIRQVRLAAERDRAARAQLAADEARTAWVQSVGAAIDAGNLIAPAGASARDLLDEENDWAEEREQLTVDLLTALESETASEIDAGRLENAERLLNGAVELSGDEAGYDSLRDALEQAFVAAESAEIKTMSDLTAVEMSAARYPRRAAEMGVAGWVDVTFTVAPDGTTSNIEITDRQPDETFDRAAVRAVERWRFEPVEFRGQIISQRAGARLKFELE